MWAHDGLEPFEERPPAELHGGLQLDNGPRTVPRAGGRFMTKRRLGASLDWAGFERHDWTAAHVTADTTEEENQSAQWGLGVARLSGRDDRWGGSLELAWEGRPRERVTAQARYQLGVLTDKRLYHDLSAHVGVSWRRVGLSAGYRAWLTPLRNSSGPEALLRLWL